MDTIEFLDRLRWYQRCAVDFAVEWAGKHRGEPGARLFMAAPTGSGKSMVELALLLQLDGWWLITPRVEIISGMLDKLGVDFNPDSQNDLLNKAWSRRIATPIVLRNVLMAGKLEPPAGLLVDEGHHDAAGTYQDLHTLCGVCPAIALSACPYRGTPRGTKALLDQWGEPTWILTYPEAVKEGVISFPCVTTVGLVDDDAISIRNGELVADEVTSATIDRLDALIDLIAEREFLSEGAPAGGCLRAPTMVSLPTMLALSVFTLRCFGLGLPSVGVTGETSHANRRAAFRQCLERRAILAQINVVSEGVDLPIRNLYDAAPTLSPVKWIQQVGRIMRPVGPDERPPEYVCTNRNLMRHGYLLDGCLPERAFKEATEAFPAPPRRAFQSRVVGLEAIGRLQPAVLPLRGGVQGLCYALSHMEGHRKVEYFAILHPARAEVIWARRENAAEAGRVVSYGRWTRCATPTDLAGFASVPSRPVTEKMMAWWQRSAAGLGLDHTVEPTRKQFPALPVLVDLRPQGVRL